ncbi:hypothetical protein [Thermoplasma volcanium GSS1]|uniref:Glycosyltransferase 2-like domain-containing protein n=1 Tax=Thermoplasma volcanium (strain ATCC 51530 / DSM 4299 / JCM 9571 / NBRC 15438 / GSS1) TaxID=273116 RepID=Q97AB7_THEVO|nr:glycosyltransferase family A protein [Thermoplasma volcanium]BAB60035.1 hypothetical protein [Thermoplasma volcanium GSS1]
MENEKLPYISVIIIAYNRKEFLLDAIKSALNQTLDREYYEIIVIKNFQDDTIDNFIKENNIKGIISENKSLGGKISEALYVSKGEIVSFLEDDDLFFPNKLREVYDIFISNPNLVYYHNNFIKTNNRLFEIDYSENKKNKKIFLKLIELNNIKTINYLISKKLIAFNMSAITIRKSYFNDCLDILENIRIAHDMCFFFCLSGKSDTSKEILIYDKPLSIWFIHNSWSNTSCDLEIKNFKNKNFTIAKETLNAIVYIFNEFCIKNNLYNFYDNKQPLCDYLKLTISARKSQLYLLNEYEININDIKLFFKFVTMRKSIYLSGAFILVLFGKFISKKLSTKIFLYISFLLNTI